LINSLLDLWEQSTSFKILENRSEYNFTQIESISDKIKKDLLSITDIWENTFVYIDIKDRKTFIILFITLLKLKSKIVLLPIEIAPEEYFDECLLCISDNKKNERSIFISRDFQIINGKELLINKVPGLTDNANIYLYTSGSTGKAKLIPKSDINLLTELYELHKIFGVSPDFTFCFTPPLYHIYGLLFGLLLPIFSGSKLIIDYYFTPESIAKFASENKIDFFVSIPAYYNMISDLNLIENFSKCRILSSSSAPLSKEISSKFYQYNINITEVYGSTETGGIAYRISPVNELWKLFSYVKIIKNSSMISAAEEDNLEFIIDSPAISVFYNKQEGYNTGDMVKFYDNDKFILTGRNTRFVKIKGKRVDLQYIHEKMKTYLINYYKTEFKDEMLYVGEKNELIFVLFEFNFPKNNTEMKKELKEHLPGYAVPKFFINVNIPRNIMGKINKVEINNIFDNYIK
jgi:acyl-coenzyme A synthetase/AMP-(fatty) acid ligase